MKLLIDDAGQNYKVGDRLTLDNGTDGVGISLFLLLVVVLHQRVEV